MKKHILLMSHLLIVLSMVIGFVCIVYRDTTAYQELAEEHVEKTLRLADNTISCMIKEQMIKPVTVSKTMANDAFLKDWLLHEPENAEDAAYLAKIYNYLNAYQLKYNYTTVFCVSAQTLHYYYQDGLNKTVSPDDEHDVWYFNFLATGQEHDLQVDTDETQDNCITVFVNFRIEDDDGQLLGVIGVGLQIDALEEIIRTYEKDCDMSIYLINARGAKNSFTGNTDIFITEDVLQAYMNTDEKIFLNQSEDSHMQWYTAGKEQRVLITKYNRTLGWYLILAMDTNTLSSVFQERVQNNLVFLGMALAACILVTTVIFLYYNRRMVTMENTDELTGLPNRKLFSKRYHTFLRKHRYERKTLFMFDIDHFKNINDSRGHMFGNVILSMVGEELRKTIGADGFAARWGGDEFLGILPVAPEKAVRILEQFMDTLNSEDKNECYRVTVSVGITEVVGKHTLEQLVTTADEVMYHSKERGRGRISRI